MKQLLYAPLGWLIHLLALLPLPALYCMADVVYFFMYHVTGYRRKVVEKNIRDSFPDKDDEWHRRTVKEFYLNLADYFMETIKLLHISDDEMSRRMEFEGLEDVDRLLGSGRSVLAYFAHCGNWEWVPSITLHCRAMSDPKVRFCQVYRPLRNQWFDAMMLKLRSRFGSYSIRKNGVLREMLTMRRDGIASITGFMSDQKPSHGDDVTILEFMHHPTAMITGTATLARRLGMAVVYFDMQKPSRGHYRLIVRHITDDASTWDADELTRTYASLLEETINRNPAIWLWSHKRWKKPVTLLSEKPNPDKK